MLQWETVDENATYPFERYRAVSGKHEYRVFHDPPGQQAKTSRGFWWSGRSRRVASRRTSTTAPTAPSTGRSKPPSNGKARHPKQDNGRHQSSGVGDPHCRRSFSLVQWVLSGGPYTV
jgi:hypothetical protein